MSFWNLDRIAAALGDYDGKTAPRPVVEIESINTDSRSVGPAQVFLALIGENFDGHDYVHQAVEK